MIWTLNGREQRKLKMVGTFCAHCRKEGRKYCTQCRSVFYCSRDCQKLHWKKHKHECSGIDSHAAGKESDRKDHIEKKSKESIKATRPPGLPPQSVAAAMKKNFGGCLHRSEEKADVTPTGWLKVKSRSKKDSFSYLHLESGVSSTHKRW